MNQHHVLRTGAPGFHESINTTWLHQIIAFVITFLFIMGPRLPQLGGAFADTITGISILLLLLTPLWVQDRPIPLSLIRYIVCLLFLAAYAGLITVAYSSVDLYSFLRSVRALLNFLAAISLVLLYFRLFSLNFSRVLIRNIYWTISLHGCIVFLQFLFPDFRELVYRFTEPGVPDIIRNYRMAGLTNGGGAGASFIQAIAIIMAPVMWTHAKTTVVRSSLMIASIVNMIAIVVTGKTGLYFSIVFLPVTFLAYNWIFAPGDPASGVLNSGQLKKTSRDKTVQAGSVSTSKRGLQRLRNLAAILLVATVIYISLPIFPSTQVEVFINRSFRRTMGPLIGYFQEGVFRDPTAESLLNQHYFLPSDSLVFLFGNSNAGRAELDYIPSDAGYVRLWFALGLVGTLLMVGFYIMIMFDAWWARKFHAGLTVLSIVLSLMVLIVHAKEIFLLTRHVFSVSSLLLVSFLYLASSRSLQANAS